MVVLVLAMTVSVNFRFGMNFSNDTNSNVRQDNVMTVKGGTTIKQSVNSEGVLTASKKNQKTSAKKVASWPLSKQLN